MQELDELINDLDIYSKHELKDNFIRNNENQQGVNILWTDDAYYVLNRIRDKINGHKLHIKLVTILQYFIHQHDKNNDYETCTLNFVNGPPLSVIYPNIPSMEKQVIILSFICELYIKNIITNRPIIMTGKLTWFTFGRVIQTSLTENIKINHWVTNFTESCALNSIIECCNEGSFTDFKPKNKASETNIQETIIRYAYFLSLKIFEECYGEDVLKMEGLMCRAHELNLDILDKKTLKILKGCFSTGRKIPIRIFLVIYYYIKRRNWFSTHDILSDLTKITTLDNSDKIFNNFIMDIYFTLATINISILSL